MIVRRRKVQATDKTVGICNIRKKDQHESPTPPRLAVGLYVASYYAEREKRRNKYIPLRDGVDKSVVIVSRGGRGRSLGREVMSRGSFLKSASAEYPRRMVPPSPGRLFFR